MLRYEREFENHVFLMHLFIKMEVEKNNLKPFFDYISDNLPLLISSNCFHFKRMSCSLLDKMVRKIIQLDEKGVMVYSCLSISILVHIYLCAFKIPSNIIIGTCILEDKVFSHAWVRTEDNHLFDYRFDNYKYREIKRIDLMKYER